MTQPGLWPCTLLASDKGGDGLCSSPRLRGHRCYVPHSASSEFWHGSRDGRSPGTRCSWHSRVGDSVPLMLLLQATWGTGLFPAGVTVPPPCGRGTARTPSPHPRPPSWAQGEAAHPTLCGVGVGHSPSPRGERGQLSELLLSPPLPGCLRGSEREAAFHRLKG